jgi:bacterial/archaeal transporter family-2 protein
VVELVGGLVRASRRDHGVYGIPAIGAAADVGLTVTGQQVVSVFFDHWSLMRLPTKPITGVRLLGVSLLLIGIVLIQAL